MPAHAANQDSPSSPIPAPAPDGTNGANDGEAVVYLPTTTLGATSTPSNSTLGAKGGVQPTVIAVCNPYEVWYTVSSAVKSGAVTTWSKHVKNDSTLETFTWTTSNAVTLTANMSVSGSLTASAGIAKLAQVALGITSNFGTQFQTASKSSYTRTVTFSTAGTWIIWAGVYKGNGSVTQYKCSSSGQSYSVVGQGTRGVTFNKARVTGLTNCARSVRDLVEINAKARC